MRPRSPAEFLAETGLPALLVTEPVNIRYLSGVSVSVGSLLATPRRFLLLVDGRYRERAERSALSGVTVRDVQDAPKLLQELPQCGFEADRVTVAKKIEWKRLFPHTKFVQTTGIVEQFRRRKSEEELRMIRRAHRVTREILRRVPSALKAGITEEQLARRLAIWALELGADGLAFDPIVAFGTHTSNPHHAPTTRALRKGHLVQIDVGAKVRGYCADMSQVYFTGKPTAQQRLVYDTLCDVQRRAMVSARAGVTNHALDRLARDIFKKAGMEHAFPHALGHGVGLEIHEGITLSEKREKMALLKNEVITIEPGVYFEGKFGMRVEDMIYIA